MYQVTMEDSVGGALPSAGTGGGPATINPGWLNINWAFPVNYEPLILGFDIVAYTGSDPTNAANYLFETVRVNANVRQLVKSIYPTASLPTVNASVRAVYA